MLAYLIGSETRLKLLDWFISHPENEFFIQQIVRATEINVRNVFEELKKLETEKLVTSRKQGREKYYKLNLDNVFISTLTELFRLEKSLESTQKRQLNQLLAYKNGFPQMLAPAGNCQKINQIFEKYGVQNKISILIHWYKSENYSVWVDPLEFTNLSKEITKKFLQEGSFTKKVLQDYEQVKTRYLDFCESLLDQNLANQENKILLKLYQEYYRLLEDFSLFQWLTIYSYPHNQIYNNFESELVKQIQAENPGTSPSEAKLSLIKCRFELQDNMLITDQKKAFLEVVKIVATKKNLKSKTIFEIIDIFKSDKKLWDLLQNYIKSFSWVEYGYKGPEIDLQKLISIIIEAVYLLEKKDFKKVSHISTVKSETEKYSKDLQKKIRLYNQLIEVFASSEDSFYIGQMANSRLLEAIGQKYFLSLEQMRFLYKDEVIELLKTSKFDTNTIHGRIIQHIHFSDSKGESFLVSSEMQEKLEAFEMIENTSKKLFLAKPFYADLKIGKLDFQKQKNSDFTNEILVINQTDFNFLFEKDWSKIQAILCTEKDIPNQVLAFCMIFDIAILAEVDRDILDLNSGRFVAINSRYGEVWLI